MPTHRRDRIFLWWAHVVSRHPVAILFIAWALAAAAIAYSAARWNFESDRDKLISTKIDWHVQYMEMEKHLPGGNDLTVVVDAGPESAKTGSKAYLQSRAVADELGKALLSDPHVAKAVWGADFSPRLLRLAPMDEFQAELAKIAEAGPMLASPTPSDLLTAIALKMRSNDNEKDAKDADVAAQIDDFARLIAAMGAVVEQNPATTQPADFGALMTAPGEEETTWRYLSSDNNRLLFIRVTPKTDPAAPDDLGPAIAAVRAIAARVQAAHPGVEIGLTGLGVMEADETDVAIWDSTWTSILATLLIIFVLVTAYHSWRTPLLAMIALATGIAWSYGFLFLTVGHLQVLSVVFNLMLLGLGIAYGIYLSSAFELLRHTYPDNAEGFEQTLAGAFRTMGPGILTGSLTTAACFATTIFTDFTGVAEMGLIAGVGILLCFVAMFTVFPALLRLFKSRHKDIAPMQSHYFHYFQERWALPFARHPVATLAVAALLTGLSVLAIFQMHFDYDLVKMQPRNSPSVLWQERIVRDGQQAIWSASILLPTIDDARAHADKYRQLPTVDDVGGIGLLFPKDETQKLQLIRQTRDQLGQSLDRALRDAQTPAAATATAPAAGLDLFTRLKGFAALMSLATAGQNPPPVIAAALARLGDTFDRVAKFGQALDPADKAARLARLDASYRNWRLKSAKDIGLALDPSPLTPKDFPPAIINPYIDDRGWVDLEINPSLTKDPSFAKIGVTTPLDPRFLHRFVRDVYSVDKKTTGDIVQVYRSGDLIEHAYQFAGLVALVIVYLIVLLDYRRLHDSLLIMLPVAMAFAITFGIMWCIGQSINMANIIVLPLMFGIGVDSGIQVLNRYRQHPADRPPGLTQGTGKGVTITCLTSVISFASMMLSSHRGISGLGFVLATGLLMTMFACLTVMPAWLSLRQKAT